jgi:hypothetical protein
VQNNLSAKKREMIELCGGHGDLANAGEIDYVQLSIAAKSTHILKMRNKPMTDEELAWKLFVFPQPCGSRAAAVALGFVTSPSGPASSKTIVLMGIIFDQKGDLDLVPAVDTPRYSVAHVRPHHARISAVELLPDSAQFAGSSVPIRSQIVRAKSRCPPCDQAYLELPVTIQTQIGLPKGFGRGLQSLLCQMG